MTRLVRAFSALAAVAAALLTVNPAFAQQDNSGNSDSQMPADQGSTSSSTAGSGTPLQPSEIQEQQDEAAQQQAQQQQSQPPGG
ncbi:MAG TPA: hypothetical protein VMH86_06920 [Rhizomicrobium sp.]|nr:hypothetical protein [Rhizomicrobium sp.]